MMDQEHYNTLELLKNDDKNYTIMDTIGFISIFLHLYYYYFF